MERGKRVVTLLYHQGKSSLNEKKVDSTGLGEKKLEIGGKKKKKTLNFHTPVLLTKRKIWFRQSMGESILRRLGPGKSC